MSVLFDLVKTDAKEADNAIVVEEGEGPFSVMVLFTHKVNGLRSFGEFRGETVEKAITQAAGRTAAWISTDLAVATLTDLLSTVPHVSLDSPEFKITFMVMDSELPYVPA